MTVDLAVVGGGNMGAALVAGMLRAGTPAADLAVVEVSPARRDHLVAEFAGVTVTDTIPPCRGALLAVKPPDITSAARAAEAAGAIRVLSIAAGISTAAIEAAVGPGVAVVRAMPNTPALVGEGVSAICGGSRTTAADLDWAATVLGSVGTVVRVAEQHIDAVTGVAGSGPAYLFLVAEALIDAGVLAGLGRDIASALVAQLFVGSAALLAERGDPAALRAMVTSPGGTTAAGLRALEQAGVRAALLDAVMAAAARSRELGG